MGGGEWINFLETQHVGNTGMGSGWGQGRHMLGIVTVHCYQLQMGRGEHCFGIESSLKLSFFIICISGKWNKLNSFARNLRCGLSQEFPTKVNALWKLINTVSLLFSHKWVCFLTHSQLLRVTIVAADGEKIQTVTITQDWDVNHLLIVQVTVYSRAPFMLLRLFNIREALCIVTSDYINCCTPLLIPKDHSTN